MGKQKTVSSSKQEIIEKIKEQLIDVMSKNVSEEVQENFQNLVNAAKTLYKNLQRIEDQEGLIAQVEKKAETLRAFFTTKENLSLLLNNRKESKQQKVINDVLKYVHEFELALDQFLNRKVQLVWVDEKGNLLATTEDGYNQLLSMANVDSDSRGKIAENAVKTLETLENSKNIYTEALTDFNDSINNRKRFYQLALKRYEANTIEEEIGEKKPQKPQKHFYWKKDNEKDDSESENIIGKYVLSKKINNKGRIAEAYVESVINDTEEPLEENNWLRHLNSLIYEDNISAILRGDVIKKIIDKNTGESKLEQHFAVKSGSWSTAGIKQYLLLAERLKDFKKVQISPSLFRVGLPMLLTAKKDEKVEKIKSYIVKDAAEEVSNKTEKQINNIASDRLLELLKLYFKNATKKDMAKRTAILSASLNIKLEI